MVLDFSTSSSNYHDRSELEDSPSGGEVRIYSLLDYRFFTLIVFGDQVPSFDLPSFVKLIHVHDSPGKGEYWASECPYPDQLLLVRPDSYIAASSPIDDAGPIVDYMWPSAQLRTTVVSL